MTQPTGAGVAPHPRVRDLIDGYFASALRTVPFVGLALAEFFQNTFVPAVSGPRDWVFDRALRGFRSSQGRLAASLARILSPRRIDPDRSATTT